MKLSLEKLRAFFTAYQRKELHDVALINAAVLMVLFPRNGELHFLLTKRTEEVEHHKGQISFPGGAKDAEDQDIVSTALREAKEEVGLLPDAIEVLGLFDDYATPSGFIITPVVAYTERVGHLAPNQLEVAEILEIPLAAFLNRSNERVEQREHHGKAYDVYFYRYGKHEVWGATAAIIRSFLSALVDSRVLHS